MKSKEYRNREEFLRNEFESVGRYNIPLIRKEKKLGNIQLISVSNIQKNECQTNKDKGVHMFVDDYRFEKFYQSKERYVAILSQYRFIMTPDFSLYIEMPKALQIMNVFKNRYCGAYWQSLGIKVIPTISWSDRDSFSFCFDGVEKGSSVAISTIGCKKAKHNFLTGYFEMIKRIQPEQIICYGLPFKEMENDRLFIVEYQTCWRMKRYGR